MNQNLGPAEFCAVEVDCVAELELGSGSGFLFVVLCSDVPGIVCAHAHAHVFRTVLLINDNVGI